jgi:hypothetical protein
MKQPKRFAGRAGLGGMALVASAALALGACSNPVSRVTTERAVSNAVGAVANQPGVNLRISLGVTPAQLMQISQRGGGNDGLSLQVAQAITSSSIVLDFRTGNREALKSKTVAKDRANQFDFAVQVGGSTPLEIRYLNQTIYVRADIANLLSDIGQSQSKAAEGQARFQQVLQSAKSFVPGIDALGRGQWVSAQTAAFAPLLNGLKAIVPAANPVANPAASQQLLAQLRKAFTSNATYTNAGTQNGRTEYHVSLAAHNFVQQVTAALPASIASLPGASTGTKALNGLSNKIPANQTVVVDLWVRNNRAQEIDIDLNQFGHMYPFAVPLRIVIGSPAPVNVPSGASALDLSKIPQLLGGLLSGGLTNSGAASTN